MGVRRGEGGALRDRRLFTVQRAPVPNSPLKLHESSLNCRRFVSRGEPRFFLSSFFLPGPGWSGFIHLCLRHSSPSVPLRGHPRPPCQSPAMSFPDFLSLSPLLFCNGTHSRQLGAAVAAPALRWFVPGATQFKISLFRGRP